MKKNSRLWLGLALGLAAAPAVVLPPAAHAHPIIGRLTINASLTAQGRNEISGTVFGAGRRPVADIYVELLDDVGSTITRAKTTASGRFTFGGLGDGRFKLRALPYSNPEYLETVQEVTLYSVSATPGSGADRQQVDVYLRVNERVNSGPFGAPPGVVFAQTVPDAARKLYQQGVSLLREKKEKEAFDSMRQAIELFPTYYDALDRLGAEYAMRGVDASGKLNTPYLQAGGALLMKAVEVNPRGYSSVFGLGWTQYHLGLTDLAVENLRTATTLYGKGADAQLWLGKALRRAAKLDQAEAAFKRANDLMEGKSTEVHWQLAALYGDQKRYREAADELELFLKMQPKGKGNEAEVEKVRGLIKQLRDKAAASSGAATN